MWTVKLPADSRDQWNSAGLSDPRVLHLWDQQNLLGNWFVTHEPGNHASNWDTYLLFGPNATWTSKPPSLLSSGSTVIDTKDQLAHSITPLLNEGT